MAALKDACAIKARDRHEAGSAGVRAATSISATMTHTRTREGAKTLVAHVTTVQLVKAATSNAPIERGPVGEGSPWRGSSVGPRGGGAPRGL